MRHANRRHAAFSLRKVHGRTLIELLVSIALGLLILLGVGTLYLGANQSARVSSSVASVEDAGQVALSLIGASVRRAGYSEIVGTVPSGRGNLLFNGPHIRGCTGGRGFTNPASPTPADADFGCVAVAGRIGDTLAVAFQADGVLGPAQAPTLDCLGSAPPVRPATAAFAHRVPGGTVPVVQNIFFLQDDGNLMCLGNGNPGVPQPLMSNVEDFRIYYGFDREAFLGTGTLVAPPTSSSLLTADEINAIGAIGLLSPWDFVVSIHACVVVRTEERGVATVAAGASPTFLPCPATPAEALGSPAPVAAPVGGEIRRAYTQVFSIRSRASQTPTT